MANPIAELCFDPERLLTSLGYKLDPKSLTILNDLPQVDKDKFSMTFDSYDRGWIAVELTNRLNDFGLKTLPIWGMATDPSGLFYKIGFKSGGESYYEVHRKFVMGRPLLA